MANIENLLEVKTYTAAGYKPVIDFGAWRVALMRSCTDCLPQNIKHFGCHDETDEVFVLLQGRCILFVADGHETIGTIHAQDMEPGKVYNVKRSVWHSHTFDPDALVLIVENRDTCGTNSRDCNLTTPQRKQVVDLTLKFWG